MIALVAATFTLDAEAQRRLGGARNLGKQSPQVQQRQATPPQQQTPQQQQQAAPAQQPAAAAGAAAAGTAARTASPMRNLLVGAAAGLGLMALASWLGFGEGLATVLLLLVLGLALMMVVSYFMRRAAGTRPAYGTAGGGGYSPPARAPLPAPAPQHAAPASSAARPGSAMDEFMRGGAVNPASPWGVPAGFDTAGFLGNAKNYFTRLQHAWDSGDLAELQEFSTNDMFIALTHERRGRSNSRTEVVELNATLLGIEALPAEHVASVRFTGQLRIDGEVESFNEVWNLSKSADGRSGWLLAGIQQIPSAAA